MSEPRRHVVAAEFTELWRSVRLGRSNTQDEDTGPQMSATSSAWTACTDLQSPKQRRCSRYAGVNNGDSPGDAEPSQDIIWDPTSPTSAGRRNTRVVQISDIVNRIAPKDAKQKGADSPLLQWIGDSAVPSTPDVPKPRIRKRSSRQSSVDDLLKLARQFDENMQQDRETSEQLNAVNNNLNQRETENAGETNPPETVKDLKCPSPLDPAEAELRALFDCSTQRVSGRLSQSSSASTRSQEVEQQPLTSTAAERRSADTSDPAARPAAETEARGFSVNNCDDFEDDFEDDWENDDLLNNSIVLAMTQNPDGSPETAQPDAKTNATGFTSACKPTAKANSAHPPSKSQSSCSALQELCPKPKTSNRCTFKLEPNPHFLSSVSAIPPKSQMSLQKSATSKTPSIPIPAQKKEPRAAADFSDSLWDDGDDDALLYQACDRIERISDRQPRRASAGRRQEEQDVAADRRRESPAPPLPNRQSPCAFVRSKSLPGSCGGNGNYQGWNVPMRGANNKSGISQSLPGRRASLGTFNQFRDSSGTFQNNNNNNNNVDMKPQDSRSHHTAFKRNVSDSAAICNKVFVASQTTWKCSAAEIERKKQEALARRRQRTQSAPKP